MSSPWRACNHIYVYIYIHTLHYITLHYTTLHYITLHYIHTYTHTHIDTHTQTHTHRHTHTYTHIHTYTHTCTCTYMYMYIHMYIHIHISTHIYRVSQAICTVSRVWICCLRWTRARRRASPRIVRLPWQMPGACGRFVEDSYVCQLGI